ncbi:hypothetical protein [Arcobacter arenosus]|uniref:hypothetical protein n=1 Tax=Arcobacter arenosus TaxID=2576037 RepID=UPI003BA885AD
MRYFELTTLFIAIAISLFLGINLFIVNSIEESKEHLALMIENEIQNHPTASQNIDNANITYDENGFEIDNNEKDDPSLTESEISNFDIKNK